MNQIAMIWIAISGLILVVLLKGSRSGYSGPSSLLDLQEFSWMPNDLKNAYRTDVLNMIVPSIAADVNRVWGAMKKSDQDAVIAYLASMSKTIARPYVATLINQMNPTAGAIGGKGGPQPMQAAGGKV